MLICVSCDTENTVGATMCITCGGKSFDEIGTEDDDGGKGLDEPSIEYDNSSPADPSKMPWPPPPGGGRFTPGSRVRVRAMAIETSYDDMEAKVHDHILDHHVGVIEPEFGWSHLQAVVRFDSCGESHNIHRDSLEKEA